MSRPQLPAMLYKHGSMIEWDGELFDYMVVEKDEDLDAALKAGWSPGKPPKTAESAPKPNDSGTSGAGSPKAQRNKKSK